MGRLSAESPRAQASIWPKNGRANKAEIPLLKQSRLRRLDNGSVRLATMIQSIDRTA